MKNNIVILGDSFTYGHGCSDREFFYDTLHKRWVGDTESFESGPSEYCWASLLAKQYKNFNVINLSKPGTDNSYMLRKAYQVMDNDTALVIFSGTMAARMHILGNDFTEPKPWVIASPPRPEDAHIKTAKENFLKYLYNEDVFALYSVNALYAAYALSKTANSKFIWSAPTYDNIEFEEYTHRIDYMRIPTAIYYKDRGSQYRAKDRYHLNDAGHELYFEEVILPNIKEILKEQL